MCGSKIILSSSLRVLCVGHLAEGVGLSIPVEVVSEPFAEWLEHDLNGQTEGRLLGRRCGQRIHLGRGYALTGGRRPLRYEVVTARRS